MKTEIQIPAEILEARDRGAIFVVNHSAGKDSQAMTIKLREIIPAEQLIAIHAELPGVDWGGLIEHIETTAGGLELVTCQAVKSFFEMVRHRRAFPSPQYRQCTSDLKRGPIEKVIRQVCTERGITEVVNCIGIRAEESASRARQPVSKLNRRLSKAGRRVIDWLPIFDLSLEQVFATIAGAGQTPHPAYAAGMSRLSCCFCIMASRADLITAARLNPRLYAATVALEREVGHTMNMEGRGLEEVTGIAADLDLIALCDRTAAETVAA